MQRRRTRNIMSKIKATLPDNFDATDSRESTVTSEPSIKDFTANDHYYLELINAVQNLIVLKPYEYKDELKYCAYLLNELVAELEKPF